MLAPVAVWIVLARDKRELLMFGAFLLLTGLATLIWNLVP
jgi:hypothetical protein